VIYWRTSKLIRGDESVENKSNTSSPSDGASCSESLVIDMNRMVYNVDVGTMCPTKAETYLRDLQNKYWN
jgi:hypothetical protein